MASARGAAKMEYTAPVGLGGLPRPVMRRMLAGMLLTHYRSMHPRGRPSLSVVEELPLDVGEPGRRADVAIVDRGSGHVVALYAVLPASDPIEPLRRAARYLREYHDAHARAEYQFEIGVVVPESRVAELAPVKAAGGVGLRIVTYPG